MFVDKRITSLDFPARITQLKSAWLPHTQPVTNKSVIFICDSLTKPNGVIFSPSQKGRPATICTQLQISEQKPHLTETDGSLAISSCGLNPGSVLGSKDYMKLWVFL